MNLVISNQSYEVEVEEDFFVVKNENQEKNSLNYRKTINNSFIQFHFSLSGSSVFKFSVFYKMEVKNGNYMVLYNPNKNLPVNITINQNSTLFSIFIPIKKFHKLFSEDADNIHFLKDENIAEKYYHKDIIPNSTLLILNELRKFDNNSSTKKLFLKAKIYELFSYIFNKNRDLNVEQCPYLTNEENFKKIKKAKEIVIENMTDPPTLKDLSYEIDLSLKKLKEGFKKIYGKPVYQFLLEHKMELAKKLLSDSKNNVNEVSLKLGYSTASHFIAAFKNRYGVTPKMFKKNY